MHSEQYRFPKSLFLGKATRYTFLFVLFLELVSLVAIYVSSINGIVWIALILLVFLLSLKDLSLGVTAVLAELVIGSKGYLFWLEVGGVHISLRLGLFLAVILAWGIGALRGKGKEFFQTHLADRWGALIVIIVLGAGMGLIHHVPKTAIFLDANAFLFLGLAPVLFAAFQQVGATKRFFQVLTGAFLASLTKTLTILFLFSHKLIGITPEAYTWIRKTGVGEIADLGGYVRVFFQSHIFGVFLFCVFGGVLLYETINTKKQEKMKQTGRTALLLFSLCVASAAIILISLSRSFWLALLVMGAVLFVWLAWKERISWRKLFGAAVMCVFAFMLAAGIFFVVVKVPLPGAQGSGSVGLISERTTDIESEAAAASRWQLLPTLTKAALQHPVFGSGFGTTVSYQTHDPRFQAAHGNSNITTFTFEWGYLDLWLKLGLVGFAVYAWFFFFIFRRGLQVMRAQTGWERGLHIGLLASLIALTATHATTPYLNHPLGIGWLLFIAVFWETRAWKTQQEKHQHTMLPALPQEPSVRVQIVTYNSANVIHVCLTSLLKQTYPHLSIEIIDCASKDNTPNVIRKAFPQIEVIEAGANLGFGEGHNQLLRRTQTPADLVLLLNPDTRLTPTYVSGLVNALCNDPSAAAAQGSILRMKEGIATQTIDSEGLKLTSNLRVVERHGGEQAVASEKETGVERVFGVTGAAALYRMDALKQLQTEQDEVFDKTFFMYKEDVDLAYRLNHKGWHALCVPVARAYHERWATGSSETASLKQLSQLHAAKPDWMQAVSWTNHWLTILKNLFFRNILITAPQFFALEGAKALYLLIRKPTVFFRALLACVQRLPVTFRKRKNILQGSVQTFREQKQWTTN